MAEGKTEVRVVVIKGETFINQSDIVNLILSLVLAMSDPDDRQMVKKLAENITAGKVR